jgi:hypothetical protein
MSITDTKFKSLRELLGDRLGSLLVAACVGGMIGVLAHSVLADSQPGVTFADGGRVENIKVVRGTTMPGSSSTKYSRLAATRVIVPEGQRSLILARFSAESLCESVSPGSTCSIRIMIGGREAEPSAGKAFAFDSAEPTGSQSWESHSMDRSWGPVRPGNYLVVVQFATVDTATNFELDNWSLTVERVRVAL